MMFRNPILLTHARVASFGWALPAGLSIIFCLVHFYMTRNAGTDKDNMLMVLLMIQAVTLLFGVGSQSALAVESERKIGLLEFNLLTPLRRWQLFIGFLSGGPIMTYACVAVMSIFALMVTIEIGRSPQVWIESQFLLVLPAIFIGACGVMLGITNRGKAVGFVFIVAMALTIGVGVGSLSIGNFFLPIHRVGSFLAMEDWARYRTQPQVFGVEIPSLLFTVLVQVLFAWFAVWAVLRKLRNMEARPLPNWGYVLAFGCFAFLQHGMIWGLNRGAVRRRSYMETDDEVIFGMVGIVVLASSLLAAYLLTTRPRDVFFEVMSGRVNNLFSAFRLSGTRFAMLIGAIAAATMLTHFYESFDSNPRRAMDIGLAFFLVPVLTIVVFELAVLWTGTLYQVTGFMCCTMLYILIPLGCYFAKLPGTFALSPLASFIGVLSYDRMAERSQISVIIAVHAVVAGVLLTVWAITWFRHFDRKVTQRRELLEHEAANQTPV